ncbi:MAG: ChuX/HutX family heme-like substrate-binding protein [Pseudomonadota bacterium]
MTPQLLQDFQRLREANPTIRAVDAAQSLEVSEGELLEVRHGHGDVSRLALRGSDFKALLEALKGAGPVMTLTRNDAAVHETTGPIETIEVHKAIGQITGEIDLRLFMSHWHAGYHVREQTKSGIRSSFQIFDIEGKSILKIFATDDTDPQVWDRTARTFRDQTQAITAFSPPGAVTGDRPDEAIDVHELRARWRTLSHSHDFFGMLRVLGVGRLQALRLAGVEFAQEIAPASIQAMLEGAADQNVPIMCFVGNKGCIQIFSGEIERIASVGPWLNVLDDRFNLHLRVDKIASAWVVRKPTSSRGLITSIEVFNEQRDMVSQFFGERPPGGTERPAWRSLAEGLIAET